MAKFAPEPDFAVLVRDLLLHLPSPARQTSAVTPSPVFLDLLSPYLRSRFLSSVQSTPGQRPPYYWSSQLTISTNTDVCLAVGQALDRLNASAGSMRVSVNGIKRVDENTLLASAFLPVCVSSGDNFAGFIREESPDEPELELIWIYVDSPGRRGWKLHEVKMALMDELCYWRQWSATVDEAEHMWGNELAVRQEKEHIKSVLLQNQAAAARAQHASAFTAGMSQSQNIFMSNAELQFRQAALKTEHAVPPPNLEYARQQLGEVSFDDDDEDYWNRYDNSGSVITPSPELAQSLRTIRRLEEMSAHSDDNSRSSRQPSLNRLSSRRDSLSYQRPPSVVPPQYSRPASSMSTLSTASSASRSSAISFLPLLPTDDEECASGKRAVERPVGNAAMPGFCRITKENDFSQQAIVT
ncbi:hypothetical protein V1509DRAFT_620259 [Lipomyces kononenkoae]